MGVVFKAQAARRKETRGGWSSQTSVRPLAQRTLMGVRAIFSREKRRCWQLQIVAGHSSQTCGETSWSPITILSQVTRPCSETERC
jgi:hypothetical protein